MFHCSDIECARIFMKFLKNPLDTTSNTSTKFYQNLSLWSRDRWMHYKKRKHMCPYFIISIQSIELNLQINLPRFIKSCHIVAEMDASQEQHYMCPDFYDFSCNPFDSTSNISTIQGFIKICPIDIEIQALKT